jgi:hypothetical protein
LIALAAMNFIPSPFAPTMMAFLAMFVASTQSAATLLDRGRLGCPPHAARDDSPATIAAALMKGRAIPVPSFEVVTVRQYRRQPMLVGGQ